MTFYDKASNFMTFKNFMTSGGPAVGTLYFAWYGKSTFRKFSSILVFNASRNLRAIRHPAKFTSVVAECEWTSWHAARSVRVSSPLARRKTSLRSAPISAKCEQTRWDQYQVIPKRTRGRSIRVRSKRAIMQQSRRKLRVHCVRHQREHKNLNQQYGTN